MKWIKEHAKETKMTQRAVMEEAILKLKEDLERKEFEEGFQRVGKDPEMIGMANEGLEDWAELLNEMEK
jgi:hypothetical protein